MTAPYKPYKPRQVKPPEPLKVAEDIIDIIDPRIKFEIKTIALEKKYTLTTRIQPVLSIPVAYNRMTGRYELLEAPTETSARILAYYYGASPPAETVAGYYAAALDSSHRLHVNIFGREGLAWAHGGEITAPPAGTALVSKTVSSGKSGYIYGFFISAGEGNTFKINWTSGGASYSIRIPFSAPGAIQYVDLVAMNEGMPADGGTTMTITNVNAGSSGVVYQARLLYLEA